ncbi:hypothetical protein [Kribbella sp. NPDC048915]|uniref:hypothetical protein n=1 Tax=Kribbella sp. NPDC048915 TaxID=3155148 RepID=UPI0033DD5BD8
MTALPDNGARYLDEVQYMVDGRRGFQQVLVITNGDTITGTDLHGATLIEHTLEPTSPTSATAAPAAHAKTSELSPMS